MADPNIDSGKERRIKKALTITRIEAAIKAAKASQKGREVGDALLPGFFCNVQSSGHASFVLRYRIASRTRKWTIGAYPKLSLEEARQLGREATGDVARGIDVAAEKRVRRSRAASSGASRSQTMAGLVEDFLTDHVRRNCRPSTGRSYTRWLEPVLANWGDRDPADIRRADVIELVGEIAQRGPILANRTAAVIQKLFNWAIGKGRLEVNVATKIEKAKERSRQRVLCEFELRLLLEAIDRLPDRERAYASLLLLTLARRSEVGGMKWSELDLNDGVWTIPAERAKNGHEHRLPLSREAIAILAARPRDGSYVFQNATRNAPYASFSQLKDELDRLIEEATGTPVAPWNLHDLRRTGASNMPRLNVRLEVIERILNHVSGSFGGIVSTYQLYSYESEMREAAQRWAEHLAMIGGNNVIELSAQLPDRVPHH